MKIEVDKEELFKQQREEIVSSKRYAEIYCGVIEPDNLDDNIDDLSVEEILNKYEPITKIVAHNCSSICLALQIIALEKIIEETKSQPGVEKMYMLLKIMVGTRKIDMRGKEDEHK